MKTKNALKLFYLTCAGTIAAVSPALGFLWPTFDPAAITEAVNNMSAQVESTNSTVETMTSTDQFKTALGDEVSSSKLENDEEKQEKKQKKAEKRRKRQEWIAKKKEQARKAKALYKNTSAQATGLYEQGKNVYEDVRDGIDTAQDYYDQGMDYLGKGDQETEGQQTAEPASSKNESAVPAGSGSSDLQENAETYNASVSSGTNEPQVKKAVMPQRSNSGAFDLGESTLDNEEIANLAADEEFSEGNWSGEASEMPDNGSLTSEIAKRTDLTEENLDEQALLTSGSDSLQQEDFSKASEINQQVRPQVERAVGRRPFVKEKAVEMPEASQTKTEQIKTDVSAAGAVSANGNALARDVLTKTAVSAKAATTEDTAAVPHSDMAIGASQKTETGNIESGRAVSGGKAELRRAFKPLKVSYRMQFPMSFAQEAEEELKTGTNEDGKFIYSDIIATKCNMNFDDVSEEKVAECIKIFVLGNNDSNAVTAAAWKKQYNASRYDHAAADLATALTQKSYSASFDTKVAEDLENKSEALTTEREEISFAGKVNQVNQEIIIRLMEAMTGQVVTEAWNSIENIDRSFYEDKEE